MTTRASELRQEAEDMAPRWSGLNIGGVASRWVTLGLLAVVMALVFAGRAEALNRSSSFTHGPDGWTVQGWETPNWFPSGGNPGGYIDGLVRDMTYFVGPHGDGLGWEGNMLANYGGTISFDVRHPAPANIDGFVVLRNTDGQVLYGGTDFITLRTTNPPTGSGWTTYSFTLDVINDDWFYADAYGDDGIPALLHHFKGVLGNVQNVWVLADYSFAIGARDEQTYLDNVVLTEPEVAPDFDRDGTPDITDDCADEHGPAPARGCPDADNDGVPDEADACPAQGGPASNDGCPLPPAADRTPPQTIISKVKINRAKRKARFSFASNEPGSRFRCKLDKGRPKSCTSPKTFKRLKPGKHKFRVVAIDAAGNIDQTPAVKKFKIKR